MPLIAEIIDVLGCTETKVWSLRELTCSSHLTMLTSYNTAHLYSFGVNKELFFFTIHFKSKSLAYFFAQPSGLLPAVIAMSALYVKIGREHVGTPVT